MDALYYKEYFKLERNHWYFRARNRIIMDYIKTIATTNSNLKILNVGPGTGYTSELLEQFGRVKSIEYDLECYNLVKSKLSIDIELGSILNLPFGDNSFDLVCAFDVLEHVQEDNIGANELMRVCKTKGNVVVTAPAFTFLWSNHDVVNHHYRRYTMEKFSSLFDHQNIFYKTYYNFLLFIPISIFRLPNKFLKFTNANQASSGSDFSVMGGMKFLSGILYHLFYIESALIKKRIRLPWGVSIMLHVTQAQ